MKKINIFLVGILLIGFSACKKDFLDVPPTNQADASTSIQTLADARVMMTGLMRNMTSSNYYGRNFILYGDARGGDLAVYSMGRGLDGLYSFNHSATVCTYSSFWSSIYNNILQANNLIANIEKLQASGAVGDFNNVLGQALTARAMMYFDLVRLYGKPYTMDKNALGVPDVITRLDASAQPLRATVEDNYKRIMKDLTDAAPLLLKSKTNGYINFYANAAMQARVNLYMGKNTEALLAAQTVINAASLYSLYSNSNWVSSWASSFGSESIFELAMHPNEGDLGNGSLSMYLRRRAHGNSNALGYFVASDYFLNRLQQDPADVRWGVMAYDEISTSHLGASYKHSGNVALAGDGKGTSTAVNVKVIRLSEIYLIAAEAALPTDLPLAVSYLNKIRQRSPNLLPATIATISIDMILDERSKELFTEGHRFFDMMRLNKSITFNDDLGGVPISSRPKTIDRTFYKTILPIGQDEINANPGIKAQQNPEY
ncbi:MAG: RagB/SusD family nutrient uptake outer membrane protein [Ginsengibacter sp.]